MLQSTAAAAERVFEFLEEPEEDQEAAEHAMLQETVTREDGTRETVKRNVTAKDIVGEVRFDHVHFGYYPDKIIINDFSADVKPGQKIAIVGPTGAGKTTMVKLLMRFLRCQQRRDPGGRPRYQGFQPKRAAGRCSAWCFRTPGCLTAQSWRTSVTDRLDATDEEVIAAAKAAHAHHFIQTLPGGYQMELNEEASNVSQGQKQLLTIARAILADQ